VGIQVGDKAPEFTLPSTAPGGSTSLAEKLRDHNVLLAFYPKDFSSG
jgi:peroxiredoxin